MYIFICTYIHLYICIYVCMFTYKYKAMHRNAPYCTALHHSATQWQHTATFSSTPQNTLQHTLHHTLHHTLQPTLPVMHRRLPAMTRGLFWLAQQKSLNRAKMF